MKPWDFEGHLDKCRDYLDRARKCTSDDSFYPMWLSFAQEHLLRAAINKANPALGIETKNESAILAFTGHANLSQYRTAELSLVHKRVLLVYPALADKDKTKIFSMMREMRNAEAHSASPGFDLEEGWIVKFYAACESVLSAMGYDLERVFSKDEADVAIEMIRSLESEIISFVKKQIAERKSIFSALSPDEQAAHLALAENVLASHQHVHWSGLTLIGRAVQKPEFRVQNCPACSAKIVVQGRIIAEGAPTVEDYDLATLVTVLPISMDCPACGLKLSKNAELVVAGLGGQYTSSRSEDFDNFVDRYDYDLEYESWREDR